ncbi:MAG: hypothetical protein HPY82_05840 [Gammaproteobacteria bacterium]|nr:hypothetical protein [Gammaproteobacteria bacterium]
MKQLQQVPRSQWPSSQQDPARLEVWVSRDFLVQVFSESNGIRRLSVNRAKRKGSKWADQITWDELWEIKKQVGYPDSYAIEIFPRRADLVNVANMRHLWVLPEPLQVGWFRTCGGAA